MSAWELYTARMNLKGATKRESSRNKILSFINRKLPDSLSFEQVTINGAEQSIAIIDTGKAFIKKIHCLPGESFPCGATALWSETHWLITEVDAHDELYMSGTMHRCNYVLRWFNAGGEIISRHCMIEDGTKYLIGEKEERMISVGDARVALTIGKDSETVRLNRGRRFLIDDPDSGEPLAFELTKPHRLFGVYDGHGVYKYLLTETNTTDDDNFPLMIADYYKYRPDERPKAPSNTGRPPKEGWL